MAFVLSGVVAIIGLIYLLILMVLIGVAMSFLAYYEAQGAIESAQVAWLSAPSPLPEIYWFSVPVMAVITITGVALMGLLIAAEK